MLVVNATLLLAAIPLALTTENRNIILDHPFIAVSTLIAIELAVVLYFAFIRKPIEEDPEFFSDPEKLKTTLRFCKAEDNESTEEIYFEWFDKSLSIDDTEYEKIVERNQFVRVAEVVTKNAYGKSTFVAGYYAVFTISSTTLDDLYSGKLKEKDLTSSHVLDINSPDAAVLYICEVVSSKRCSVREALMSDMLSYIVHIISKNSNIKKISTWPYTRYGKKLVQAKRGFNKVETGFAGNLYYEASVGSYSRSDVRKFKPVHEI
ncbi:MAG: hypothetical protein IPG54_07555 [Sphingomonadales bacterium]|jgi:hypothetical protein|nr:hypothetical protein [Sphingomonadales bacterium]MBK9002362.1 hypothetical protein [Sphingomonadales bacterium]MBK9267590.1 hypothetical protein [Sphingomonadales bacterium]MBP6433144.1 hypothetical protein [Sphingorhabdus sp.]